MRLEEGLFEHDPAKGEKERKGEDLHDVVDQCDLDVELRQRCVPEQSHAYLIVKSVREKDSAPPKNGAEIRR